jgi:hypothetical protein
MYTSHQWHELLKMCNTWHCAKRKEPYTKVDVLFVSFLSWEVLEQATLTYGEIRVSLPTANKFGLYVCWCNWSRKDCCVCEIKTVKF